MCVKAHVGVLSGQCRRYADITDDVESSPPRRKLVEDDDGDDERTRYCTCGTDGEDGSFMIECSNGKCCKGWVHPSCVGLDMSEEEAMKLENFVCPWCRAMIGPAAVSPKKSFRNQESTSFKDEFTTEELREMLEEKGLDSSGRHATLFSRLQTYEREQIRKERSSPATTTVSTQNEDLDVQKNILNEIRQAKNDEEENQQMDIDEEEEEEEEEGGIEEEEEEEKGHGLTMEQV